jgi:prophage regulatory protein
MEVESGMEEDRFLRIEEVMKRVGIKRTAIYGMVALGTFPKPIKLSKKAARWSNNEISAWIAEHLYNRG